MFNDIVNNSKLIIFCDGGARGNPGPAASAFVIKDAQGKIVHKEGIFLGVKTNNQAEYHAVVSALHFLSKEKMNNLQEIRFYLDSVLVVSQINGIFKIKNSELRESLVKIRELESLIKCKIVYSQIPREENYEADALVNYTLDNNS